MSRITVRPARPDLKVPTGDGGYFAPDKAVDVERTRYIQRRIDDGDLVQEPAAKSKAHATTGQE